MNQILVTDNNHYFNNNFNYKNKKTYLIIFCISISICITILFYLTYSFFDQSKQNKKTKMLKNKYNIITLYSNNISPDTLQLSNDISIVGLIEIPKINISYPILGSSSEKLLKISICRFSGPLPNRIGNMCLAGHNYKNNLMFSKLYVLDVGDTIYITDLNNTKLEYTIYDKLKVKENNLDCTEPSSEIELTLITCNTSNNSERVVLKAKVKG